MFDRLRDYQARAISEAERLAAAGHKPLLVSTCGGGKSVMLGALALRPVLRDGRSVVIVPNARLGRQVRDDIHRLLDPVAKVSFCIRAIGVPDLSGQIVIATTRSLINRLDQLGRIDTLIVDEAHLVGLKSGTQHVAIMTHCRNLNSELRVIGATGSPWRLESRGSASIVGPMEVFSTSVDAGTYATLLRRDPPVVTPVVLPVQVFDTFDVEGVKVRHGDFVASELELRIGENLKPALDVFLQCARKRLRRVIFVPTVASASCAVEHLRLRGDSAHAVTGETPEEERERLFDLFTTGEVSTLVSVDVLGIGWDVPLTDCVAMMRPTKSLTVFTQQLGRGIRVVSGKTDCLLLDFAGNLERHGSLLSPKVLGERTSRVWRCWSCGAANTAATLRCMTCFEYRAVQVCQEAGPGGPRHADPPNIMPASERASLDEAIRSLLRSRRDEDFASLCGGSLESWVEHQLEGRDPELAARMLDHAGVEKWREMIAADLTRRIRERDERLAREKEERETASLIVSRQAAVAGRGLVFRVRSMDAYAGQSSKGNEMLTVEFHGDHGERARLYITMWSGNTYYAQRKWASLFSFGASAPAPATASEAMRIVLNLKPPIAVEITPSRDPRFDDVVPIHKPMSVEVL
ncbi:MAG: hypothetical protein EHM67_00145 [Hyphomicrobiaceae bacterium]|nr:MAG: hypothetical protein EHM67_00145 [Hyphomicrobiaceae bacterium]